jgi:hypothetical protein
MVFSLVEFFIKRLLSFRRQLLLFIPTLFLVSSTHKYYHSHCTLELNHKTGNAEAVIEVFWHDLEVSISKNSSKKVKVTDKDFPQSLKSYLENSFVLKDSLKKSLPFQLVGHDIKNDEMNIYLEFEKVKNWYGMQLENSLMIKEYPEQINQVNLKSGARKNSLVFTSKVTTLSLK